MGRILDLYIYGMKNYAKFQGRACRMEAISFMLVYTVLFAALFIISAIFAANQNTGAIGGLLSLLAIIVALAHLIPGFAVMARRLHDLNLSGWLLVLYFIPILNIFASIVFFVLLYFIPGTEGDNQYGKVSENY